MNQGGAGSRTPPDDNLLGGDFKAGGLIEATLPNSHFQNRPGPFLPLHYLGQRARHPTIHKLDLLQTLLQRREDLIGTPASAGCVCLKNSDVIELYDLVPPSTLS